MDKFIIAILGIIGIAFTWWFFLFKKDEVTEAAGDVDIVVKGGYKPSTIQIKKDRKTIFKFLREDENSCLEEVVIPEFKIKRFLPLNQAITFELTPKNTGEFPFSCGMGMFHGKIIVKK